MEEIFIKDIHINKVRHLENIHIPISPELALKINQLQLANLSVNGNS